MISQNRLCVQASKSAIVLLDYSKCQKRVKARFSFCVQELFGLRECNPSELLRSSILQKRRRWICQTWIWWKKIWFVLTFMRTYVYMYHYYVKELSNLAGLTTPLFWFKLEHFHMCLWIKYCIDKNESFYWYSHLVLHPH